MAVTKKGHMEFFGHVMGKDGPENLAVIGTVEGKRSRGKRRYIFTEKLREGLEVVYNTRSPEIEKCPSPSPPTPQIKAAEDV